MLNLERASCAQRPHVRARRHSLAVLFYVKKNHVRHPHYHTSRGFARSGATTINGAILRDATRDNVANYREVVESGLGSLLCLGCEVFGRWADDIVRIMPAMAAEKARGLPPLVRRGATQALAARWWGLLAVATQRLVARAVLRDAGADLVTTLLEDPPGIADLPVSAF